MSRRPAGDERLKRLGDTGVTEARHADMDGALPRRRPANRLTRKPPSLDSALTHRPYAGRVRRATFALAVLGVLVVVSDAAARIVVAKDHDGRPMRFDVRARGADVWWYASLLRNAAHGNEISRVTVRIVPRAQVARTCSYGHALGCYASGRERGLIVVPAGRDGATAHTVLHEYAHHLDRWRGVRGVPEPNGTANWWQARGMARHVRASRVARDYSRGWDRSIAEVFAEDYASLHLELSYRIGWLLRPDEAIRAALRRDVAGVPAASGAPPPLTIVRSGTLSPRSTVSIPFGLLGPGRRVTVSARLAGASGGGTATVVLSCGGREVVDELSADRVATSIDESNLGPDGSCRAAITNSGTASYRFTLRVRLAIERGA